MPLDSIISPVARVRGSKRSVFLFGAGLIGFSVSLILLFGWAAVSFGQHQHALVAAIGFWISCNLMVLAIGSSVPEMIVFESVIVLQSYVVGQVIDLAQITSVRVSHGNRISFLRGAHEVLTLRPWYWEEAHFSLALSKIAERLPRRCNRQPLHAFMQPAMDAWT